jgi:PadR family transcriptional regulator
MNCSTRDSSLKKLVVPGSLLHEIESSLATHLKDRINTYQHYLGQVRLYRQDEIRRKQSFVAFDRFIGLTPEDPLGRWSSLILLIDILHIQVYM